jgi:hypothetical protein
VETCVPNVFIFTDPVSELYGKGCVITGESASIDRRKSIDNRMAGTREGAPSRRKAEQKDKSTRTCVAGDIEQNSACEAAKGMSANGETAENVMATEGQLARLQIRPLVPILSQTKQNDSQSAITS